ncbi:MAG: branched-chain amino acid ABC transporter permease [Actinomycetota bacterium]|nr:branched-chain amino acid ABC transporter permease [Actinomycetota bacterium]
MSFLGDLAVNVVITAPLVGAYVMFSLGIVFIHRSSRVLNLSHGAMAMFPAFVAYDLARRLPVPVALVAAVAFGAVLGLIVERGVVRRLRDVSSTAQTVGTVAVFGLLVAVAARIWGTTPLEAPSPFPDRVFRLGNGVVSAASIGLFVVSLALAAGFVALFRFTDLGLAMRAAADNRRAAAYMGIDPERTTAVAWLFAGALAGLGGSLLAGALILHPYVLALQVLPAFVAALIGGLDSVTGALWGSAVVGLTVGIVPTLGPAFERQGTAQVALALLAFVVMSLRGGRFAVSDVRSGL